MSKLKQDKHRLQCHLHQPAHLLHIAPLRIHQMAVQSLRHQVKDVDIAWVLVNVQHAMEKVLFILKVLESTNWRIAQIATVDLVLIAMEQEMHKKSFKI